MIHDFPVPTKRGPLCRPWAAALPAPRLGGDATATGTPSSRHWRHWRHRRHCTPTRCPRQNPALQHCYVKYNELFRCYSIKGKEAEECARIKKDARCRGAVRSAAHRSALPAWADEVAPLKRRIPAARARPSQHHLPRRLDRGLEREPRERHLVGQVLRGACRRRPDFRDPGSTERNTALQGRWSMAPHTEGARGSPSLCVPPAGRRVG
eukprot:scaffold34.g4512.t1